MIERSKVTKIKKSLGATLLKLYFQDNLIDEIEKVPIKRNPKNKDSLRCCIYKDRAMSRYRLMALMGIDIENEDNEFNSLSDFTQMALKREKPDNDKPISIVDMSCISCQQHKYVISDICKACEARPCETNCPKNSISILNGKSIINYDTCISCGKCYNVCPYKAVIHSPIPCEEVCPVDAIYRDEKTGKEVIDYSKCIFCGKCIQACPFGTIVERSQMLYIAKQIKTKNKQKPIIAMLAPSIIGQFPGTVQQVITALKQIGFDYVYEVAYGADITAQHEAQEIIERSNDKQFLMGTSCCPAYIEAVRKHVKTFEKYISKAKTPMAYTAEFAKQKFPDCKTVFIGPCVAKKFEGFHNNYVDYVLTFEELSSFFLAFNIEITELKETSYDTIQTTKEAQHFCVSGGVANTVKYYSNKINPLVKINSYLINGLGKKGFRELKNTAKGKLPYNLIECMSCEGGCLSGPGVNVPSKISIRKLN
ncbi:MAG: monomeric [FeFe] hydrogenase [Bacteroidales bacterium]|nr:monomeric [FeFe] hydrogenase [Bacteroidales bacterium]